MKLKNKLYLFSIGALSLGLTACSSFNNGPTKANGQRVMASAVNEEDRFKALNDEMIDSCRPRLGIVIGQDWKFSCADKLEAYIKELPGIAALELDSYNRVLAIYKKAEQTLANKPETNEKKILIASFKKIMQINSFIEDISDTVSFLKNYLNDPTSIQNNLMAMISKKREMENSAQVDLNKIKDLNERYSFVYTAKDKMDETNFPLIAQNMEFIEIVNLLNELILEIPAEKNDVFKLLAPQFDYIQPKAAVVNKAKKYFDECLEPINESQDKKVFISNVVDKSYAPMWFEVALYDEANRNAEENALFGKVFNILKDNDYDQLVQNLKKFSEKKLTINYDKVMGSSESSIIPSYNEKKNTLTLPYHFKKKYALGADLGPIFHRSPFPVLWLIERCSYKPEAANKIIEDLMN